LTAGSALPRSRAVAADTRVRGSPALRGLLINDLATATPRMRTESRVFSAAGRSVVGASLWCEFS
jgi:hypothetical protein